METVLFFKFPAARAQEYTDLEKFFSQSGNNTELTETYRSCLAKGELLVYKINHDQVSAEQKLGLTKVRPYLFLMLINLIAPALTVPNRTVIPWTAETSVTNETGLKKLVINHWNNWNNEMNRKLMKQTVTISNKHLKRFFIDTICLKLLKQV